MNKEFSTEYIKQNCGCYTPERLLIVYKENKDVECYEEPKCTSTLEEILDSNIPLKDKYWFVCRKLATEEQNQQIAIGVAETVIHIFEEKYPNDKRPREAIQAAKDYLKGVIDIDELKKKRDAADAAAAAAAAYAAAAYAADAADAAAAAAYAAAYAAAAYAADAARKLNLNDVLLQYLKDFCNNA